MAIPSLPPVTAAPAIVQRRQLPLRLEHQLAVVRRERRSQSPGDEEARRRLEQARALGPADDHPLAGRRRVDYEDLVPPARLMPALRRHLGSTRSGALDLPRLVDRVAAYDLPKHMPRRALARWHPDLIVILDFSARLWPYRADMHRLARRLLRACGAGGVSLRIVERGPLGTWSDWVQEQRRTAMPPPQREWATPPAGAPVLIVSDLGLLAGAQTGSALAWRRFARRLVRDEARALALAPVSAEHVAGEIAQLLPIVRWSPDGRMRPEHGHGGGTASARALDDLLALMSALVRVDPPLLRAMRRLVSSAPNDGGLEGAVWCHPDVEAGTAAAIRPAARALHRRRLESASPHLNERLARLVHEHHAHLHPSVRHEEAVILAAHVAPHLRDDELPEEVREAREYLSRLARTVEGAGDSDVVRDARIVARGIVARADPEMVAADAEVFHALLAGTNLPDDRVPDWADPSRLRLFAGTARGVVTCWLVQDPSSGSVVFQNVPPSRRQRALGEPLHVDHSLLRVQVGDGPSASVRWCDVRRLPAALCALDDDTTVQIVSAGDAVTLGAVPRPRGAGAWGYDRDGLFVETPSLGGRQARWSGAELKVVPAPDDARGWALEASAKRVDDIVSFGVDADHGVFADVTVATRHGRVVQRLRWIEPGRFAMGSPETEAERYPDEGPQHEVTLTRGFWLGDTACTQALWRAVTGENPSHFQRDPECPVEEVSWDAVQRFLRALAAVVPGCLADLPTEAEWEYACRAGTRGPFSFGEQITPAEVNYDGNYPYAGGAKGESRARTVPVKSLPPNEWGLYEMHGNVWEWCADGRREYTDDSPEDRIGPPGRASRAIRGGSWIDDAGSARSAYRDAGRLDDADGHLGFRLCLRSIESGSKTRLPGGQAASGPPRDEADGRAGLRERVSRLLGGRPRKRR